jgi:hypothetical protein
MAILEKGGKSSMISLLVILVSMGIAAYGVCIVAMWFMDLIDALIEEYDILEKIPKPTK